MKIKKEYDKLLEDYLKLQKEVTRFSSVKQELINTRSWVDKELERYKRLQKYNSELVSARSDGDFLALVSEAIIDVLELEIGIVYYVDHNTNKNNCLVKEGFYRSIEDEKIIDVLIALENAHPNQVVLLNTDELNDTLKKVFSQLLFTCNHDVSLGFSLYVFAAISNENQGLYTQLEPAQVDIFSNINSQVSAIFANRKRSEKIEKQVEIIQRSKAELQKLSLIATNTANGVIISNNKGEVEWVNDSFTNDTGFTLNEVIGKKPKEFLHGPATEKDVVKTISQKLAKHESFEVVITNYRKDKTPYYNNLEVMPVFDENQVLTNFIALQRDISDNITLNNRLRNAVKERDANLLKVESIRSFYERILKNSPVNKVVFDKDLNVSFSNNRLDIPHWRFTAGQKLWHHWANFKSKEIEKIFGAIEEAIDFKEERQIEEVFTKNNATTKYLLHNIYPFFGVDNSLENVILQTIDFTEIKEFQLALEVKNNELKKTNHELDNFVYSISHDLRSPLLSLKGIISLLKIHDNNKEKAQKLVGMAENSVNRLDGTIQDILDYSRNTRLELKNTRFNLLKVIKEIIDDLKYGSKESVEFIIDYNGEQEVLADKSRLNVLLKNLIGNSAKYTRADVASCVKVHVVNKENSLYVAVIDNGSGIKEEYKDKIFNMFFRGTNQGIGTGLGLYMCKEIVNKMHGFLNVDSELGVGTTFTVKIPLAQV